MRRAFLEIGALFEEHWTGIPNVVAALAELGMADHQIDWHFVYDTIEVPRDLVRKFLSQRSGSGGLRLLADLAWQHLDVPAEVAAESVCVFPNIKPVQRFFGREAVIVHDLSPVIAPQFHNADNIIHFAYRIRQDVSLSDHVFCVSNATMHDVHKYLGRPLADMSVLRLGCDLDPADIALAQAACLGGRAEPYILVIGTLEPRKNGRIVLEYLARDPGFALRNRIVFLGRDGWLDERNRLMALVAQAGVAEDRIIFTGFVSDTEKVALTLNSRFCVYSSFFEGFGLPVLEAGALGKMTVCSNSSSMPEVMPELSIFFDPLDLHEFGDALRLAERRTDQTRSSARSLADLMRFAQANGWNDCYEGVARWVSAQ